MYQEKNQLHFFLGANTPQGYVSRFEQLATPEDGWRIFIIKGAPGCGKSTLFQKVAQVFEDRYQDLEYIRCSSDQASLDGIVLPQLKIALADGTAPHLLEPKYPGVVETVISLSDCWDEEKLLGQRQEILSLYHQSNQLQMLCCRYLGAAASLLYHTCQLVGEITDKAKISRFTKRLAARELHPKSQGQGRESIRFLSAVTDQGRVVLEDTARQLASHLYLIQDDYGATGRLLLSALRSHALAQGYDIVSCYCPLAPFDKLEHLFIPQLSLGFVTCNRFHPFPNLEGKVIHSRRFTDPEQLRLRKKKITLNRKAATQLLAPAEKQMGEYKKVHDQLEACYRQAMNFDEVTQTTARVINRLETLAALQERFGFLSEKI